MIDIANFEADAPEVCVGLDIGGTKIRGMAADASGHLVADTMELTAGDVFGQITRLAAQLGGGTLTALGIGVPGAVDPRTGRISKTPNIPGLAGLALESRLREELGIPVAVENDLSAAAIAEGTLGGHDCETIAVVGAGTGIGLGLSHRGRLLRGFDGAAGEIADIPLGDGRYLEEVVSIAGLLASYRLHGGDPSLGVPNILSLARAADATAVMAIQDYAYWLAHAVRVIVAVLDPGRVVVTGGIGSHPTVHASLRRQLGAPLNARLSVSALGSDLPAHGALLLAHRAQQTSPTPQFTA